MAGVGLFFICQTNDWGIHDYGGHIWYLVGLLIAGSSLGWFGAIDRMPPSLATVSLLGRWWPSRLVPPLVGTGIYTSTDGGNTWQVRYRDDR